MSEPDLQADLRASLAAQARQAPTGQLLAERIIEEALLTRPARDFHRPRGPRWRIWALPLLAAGSVAAIVGALVGVNQAHHAAAPARPAVTHPVTPPPAPSPGPSPRHAASKHVAPAPGGTATNPIGLARFRVLDLSFVGTDDGWALGTAACVRAPSRTCTGLAHTLDGVHWTGATGPHSTPFRVAGVQDCAAPCVAHIRFANDQVGYAFGPSALFMTTNGGVSWQHESGGAAALETLDNNVIRVTSAPPGCVPPGCTYGAETASIGSAKWTRRALDARTPGMSAGVALVRGGQDAYVEVFGHPTGGAVDAQSALYRSADDGRSWQAVGEPCPQTGQEVDSVSVAAAPGGRASVLCTTRQAPSRSFVAISTDHGASFAARPGTVAASSVGVLVGDPDTVLLAAGGTGATVSRSTDRGASWQTLASPTGGFAFAGFESATAGRLVSSDGRTVWTTHDAGRSWSPVTFSS